MARTITLSAALHESFLQASREIRASLIGRFARKAQAVEIVIESTREKSGTRRRLLPRGNRRAFFVTALPSRQRAWRGARLCAKPPGDARRLPVLPAPGRARLPSGPRRRPP